MSTSSISIHIVTYNGEDCIGDCLNSIYLQTLSSYHLICIDNGSSDTTTIRIKQFLREHPYISSTFIPLEKNFGFAAGHNIALEHSQARYCIFLNQDVVLDEKFLQYAVNFLNTHPQCGSISPKVLRLTDSTKTSIIDSLGITIKRTLQAVDIDSGKDEKTSQHTKEFEILGPSGATPIFRRAALDSVVFHSPGAQREYVDEDFLMYKDDVDLAYRLTLSGWKSYCVPNIVAFHRRSAKEAIKGSLWYNVAFNRIQKKVFINSLSYRNHWFLYVKDIPFFLIIRSFPFVVYYEFKKLIFLFLFERRTLFVWHDIYRKRKIMLQKRRELFLKRRISWQEYRQRMFQNS